MRAQRLDDQARAACDRGDFLAAAEATEGALRLLRAVFAPGSTQLAHEEMKLSQLRFNVAPDATARAALEKAARMMAACYGEGCEDVAVLRQLAASCRPRV